MTKKPTLKKYILNELTKEGYISRDKVWAISKQFGHTDATVERILRPSMSPIKPVKNEKKHIIGYKLKEEYAKMLVDEKGKANVAYKIKVPVSVQVTQEVRGPSQDRGEAFSGLQMRAMF